MIFAILVAQHLFAVAVIESKVINYQLSVAGDLQITGNYVLSYESLTELANMNLYEYDTALFVLKKIRITNFNSVAKETELAWYKDYFGSLAIVSTDMSQLQEKGSIRISYLIKRKRIRESVTAKILLRKDVAIKKLTIKVSFPRQLDFNYHILGDSASLETGQNDTLKIYLWEFNHLPAVNQTLSTSKDNYPVIPQLSFSTLPLRTAYFRLISQEAFLYAVTPAMRQLVDSLQQKLTGHDQFVVAIQKFVIARIKVRSWPGNLPMDGIKTATETYNSGSGNKLDVAVLLTALLQTAGFKAVPVLIYPTQNRFGIKNLNSFSDVMLRVYPVPGHYLYVSVDHQLTYNSGFDLAGITILPLFPVMRTFDPQVVESNHSLIQVEGVVKQKARKFKLKATLKLSGKYFNYYQFISDSVQFVNSLWPANQVHGKNDLFEVVEYSKDSAVITLVLNSREGNHFDINEFQDHLLIKINNMLEKNEGLGFLVAPSTVRIDMTIRQPVCQFSFRHTRQQQYFSNSTGRVSLTVVSKGSKVNYSSQYDFKQAVYFEPAKPDLLDLIKHCNFTTD